MKETKTIKMSKNWNGKLNCPFFTSFSLHSPKYYRIGSTYEILLKKKGIYVHCRYVVLLHVNTTKLNAVSNVFTLLDAGMSRIKFIEMVKQKYKNKVEDFDNALFSIMLFGSA